MDSLTHILTGAAIGQMFSEKNDKSRRPLVWGAIAGSIPDLDAIVQPFISQENSMLFHRGISHSLLLWALCSPLLALLLNKIGKGDKRSYFKWLKISVTAWLSHIVLDLFNTYGTGIFEPFSHARISYDAVNVIDLFYLIPILTMSVFCVFYLKNYVKKVLLASAVVTFSAIYIAVSVFIKISMENTAEMQCAKQNIRTARIISSPLPISNLAWKIVAETDDGHYVGTYYGFWKNYTPFRYIPKNMQLENELNAYDNFRKLKQFTKNCYALEQKDGQIFMTDLRFTSLEPQTSALCFPLLIRENSLEIKRTMLNRRISFDNIKELCERLKAEN
ncbi:MAG: metal-dependent hydrolase [Prevotellaceae bacterium]|jgi:inner membrane protein|nr:metal-dependent hydrolase [Prevotellaceae bacterium]